MRKKVKTKLKRCFDLDQIKIQQQTIQFDIKWILVNNHNPTLRLYEKPPICILYYCA